MSLGITALAGLALMENGVDRDDPAIKNADRVVRSLATRSNQTYDLALAILFLARRMPGSRGPDDELIELLGRRLAAGQREGMWSYLVPLEDQTARRRRGINAVGQGDNSNTQFALLGIWTASRHGLGGDDGARRDRRSFPRHAGGEWGLALRVRPAGQPRDELRRADGAGDLGGPPQTGREADRPAPEALRSRPIRRSCRG